jgi:hypothetical protein
MKATTKKPGKSTNIPKEMRAAKRWLLWAPNKQPFYASGKPRNGALDTPKDTGQLVAYAEAVKALSARPERFAGLGFRWQWKRMQPSTSASRKKRGEPYGSPLHLRRRNEMAVNLTN